MKYKLIALDIDDTLVNSEKVITPETKEALINAQKLGIKLAIASGRFPKGVMPFFKELQIDRYGGYRMSFNGGAIYNSEGEAVSKTYLDKKYIEPVYSLVRPTTAMTVVHKNGKMYCDRKQNAFSNMPSLSNNGIIPEKVDDIARFADFNLHKIVIVDENEKLKKLEKVLKERFNKELDIYFSAPWYLEVMPNTVSKGIGLEIIAKDMGISLGEVIAFGDNHNDISMLEAAGMGVAMGNADDSVKSRANMVTDNCDRDGIAKALKILLS